MLTIENNWKLQVLGNSLAIYYRGKLIDFPYVQNGKICWGIYPLCFPKQVRKTIETVLKQNQ